MRRSQGRGVTLHKIHLTFLEALLCDIAQSQSRKSLEKTLIYLTLHLQL